MYTPPPHQTLSGAGLPKDVPHDVLTSRGFDTSYDTGYRWHLRRGRRVLGVFRPVKVLTWV